jgi:hypothetical protein
VPRKTDYRLPATDTRRRLSAMLRALRVVSALVRAPGNYQERAVAFGLGLGKFDPSVVPLGDLGMYPEMRTTEE